MVENVVVVESPAKAKTINKYLGNDFIVLASYGHIRDLPAKNGSVNPDADFDMIWSMDDKSKRHVDAIAKAMKGASNLYLATDPDREGEAISWHVNEVLRESKSLKNMNIQRIVFNEITKKAVQAALEKPRAIDTALVDAYLARRALDYLVGFTLSPVLWRKLPGAKSAGRVQSVALRIIVDRECEIEQFKSKEYWSVAGLFLPGGIKDAIINPIESRLTHYDGNKLDKFSISNEIEAKGIVDKLSTLDYHVSNIDKKQVKRNPSAPFITSTLQQEASRKLGFSASRTMQIAQKLYEGVNIGGETFGLITYMRTDSTNMANDAINEARDFLAKSYGSQYVPAAPRVYKTKAKNAQEAHECIRPTKFSLTPDDVTTYLDESQKKLYELIWKRALSSQMENALFDQVSVDFSDPTLKNIFRATGTTQIFDGFLKLYQEGRDEPSEDDDNKTLPPLSLKQDLTLQSIIPNQHFTQPPPRFSEASLVKKLEELGIGRPSTYAPLLQTLQDRQYVRLEKRQFIPEDRGRIVTSFLIHYFPKYVEYDFTAQLEEELDDISAGSLSWKGVMEKFWKDFKGNIEATSSLTITDVIDSIEKDLILFLFNTEDSEARKCPVCKTGTMNLKLSKYGAFVGCSAYPECKHTRPLVGVGDDADAIMHDNEEKLIGTDPNNNIPIMLKRGPYGYYFEWQGVVLDDAPEPVADVATEEVTFDGKKPKKKRVSKKAPKAPKPKRVSLPTGVLPANATLEMAVSLSKIPYTIGNHPEDGLKMTVGLGRFGPYVKHGTVFASIPKTMDYFNLNMIQALECLERKNQRLAKKESSPEKKASSKSTKKAAPKVLKQTAKKGKN